MNLIISRYYKILRAHKLRTGTIADHDDLSNTGLIGWMWLEIVTNIIFIPPYLNQYFTIKGCIKVVYDYTSVFFNTGYLTMSSVNPNLASGSESVILYYNMSCIILFFMLFRIYHVFRLVNSYSFFTTPKAESICGLMNTKANTSFALRAYLKVNPFGVLLITMVFIIAIFGISMQILEYYNAQIMAAMVEDNNQYVQIMNKFCYFFNSLWVVIVTMTTIGYGDIYPTTYFGRIVATLTCIFGIMILSLLVVFTNYSITLDEVEKHVYQKVMEGRADPDDLRKEATSLIGTILRYNYLRKKHENDGTTLNRLYLWIELKYNSKRFKIKRIASKKQDRDIDELLDEFTLKMRNEVAPFRNNVNQYTKAKHKVS